MGRTYSVIRGNNNKSEEPPGKIREEVLGLNPARVKASGNILSGFLRDFFKIYVLRIFLVVYESSYLFLWYSWLKPTAVEYTDVGSILACVEFVQFCTSIFIIISFQRLSFYF